MHVNLRDNTCILHPKTLILSNSSIFYDFLNLFLILVQSLAVFLKKSLMLHVQAFFFSIKIKTVSFNYYFPRLKNWKQMRVFGQINLLYFWVFSISFKFHWKRMFVKNIDAKSRFLSPKHDKYNIIIIKLSTVTILWNLWTEVWGYHLKTFISIFCVGSKGVIKVLPSESTSSRLLWLLHRGLIIWYW